MEDQIKNQKYAPLAVILQRGVSFAQWIPVIGVILAPTIAYFSKYESIIDTHFSSSMAWHMVTSGILLGLLLRMAN